MTSPAASSTSSPEFARLVSEHRRSLKAYLLTLVQDYHLAEDLLQETLAIVSEREAQGEAIQHFRAFAREVGRRQALKALRSRQYEPVLLSEAAMDAVTEAFAERDTEGEEERLNALQGCMRKLPSQWSRILKMRFWQAQKVNAIAARLRIRANVVSVTLNRAKSRLATCVAARMKRREVRL